MTEEFEERLQRSSVRSNTQLKINTEKSSKAVQEIKEEINILKTNNSVSGIEKLISGNKKIKKFQNIIENFINRLEKNRKNNFSA